MTLEPGHDTEGIEQNANNTSSATNFAQVFKERPLYFIIPICLTIFLNLLIFVICFVKKNSRKDKEEVPMEKNSFCASENCVRCSKYEDTRYKSIEKLKIYERDIIKKPLESILPRENIANEEHIDVSNTYAIQRVVNAVILPPAYDIKKKQNPNVLSIANLPSTPFWTEEKYKTVEEILERNFQTILTEFLALPAESHWLENTTPHGSWRVFHLINQGIVQKENCALVPETMKLVNSLPGLMKHNIFGNVCFSIVDPGTWITPHYGPCNCRIRCHLGLITSPQYHLIVDGVRRRSWRNGRCLFFDDSYLHEVRYLDDSPEHKVKVNAENDKNEENEKTDKFGTNDSSEDRPASSLGNIVAKRQRSREEEKEKWSRDERMSRAILMVDLWHPGLTKEEIDILNYVFPSSETSYEEWRSQKEKSE